MMYKIMGCDATLSNPAELYTYTSNHQKDGDWTEFDWYDFIECEPEKLLKTVSEWLNKQSRTIEVFTVKNESDVVVMTEENILLA